MASDKIGCILDQLARILCWEHMMCHEFQEYVPSRPVGFRRFPVLALKALELGCVCGREHARVVVPFFQGCH